MEDSSRIMTRGMKRKLEKGKEGDRKDDKQQNPQEKPKSKKFKPAPMEEASPPQNTAAHQLGRLWPPVSENEAGSSTQHQNLSSSSEIQQPGPYLDQKITVKHSEIGTALGEYGKLIRSLEQGDTQAFNQGIERMEQLSKNSAYIDKATEVIKQAKDPEEQLFFVKEFKRIAEANILQLANSSDKHREISTALGEYGKLIRSLEQGDTQAFNQGIERMEQLSKNSTYIDKATEAIKQAKDPEEQLFFVKEFKRIAEANLTQI